MATLFVLNRSQYFEGMARVYRGDAWSIEGQVIDRIGGVGLPMDLTGASATAYFPATGGGTVAASVEIVNATAGFVRVPVDEDVTPTIDTAEDGIQLYVVVDGIPATGNLFTAQMPNPDLQIVDRSFQQF